MSTWEVMEKVIQFVKNLEHPIRVRFRPSRFHSGLTECKVWVKGLPTDYSYGKLGWQHISDLYEEFSDRTIESFEKNPEKFLERVTLMPAQRELTFPSGVSRDDMIRAVYALLFEEYCEMYFDEEERKNDLSNPYGLTWPQDLDTSSATVEDYC